MIVPYDPDRHQRFVFSGFCRGAGEPWEWLHYQMRHGARCALRVARDNPDLFYGFAVVSDPQVVAWTYVKERLRGNGFMRDLLAHLGVDVSQPMLSMLRSPVADRLISRGWPICYPCAPAPVNQEACADGRR